MIGYRETIYPFCYFIKQKNKEICLFTQALYVDENVDAGQNNLRSVCCKPKWSNDIK